MGKDKHENGVSKNIISSIVSDVFAKHGINPNEVTVSEEKRKEVKRMVNDLTKQVKGFVSSESKKAKKNK